MSTASAVAAFLLALAATLGASEVLVWGLSRLGVKLGLAAGLLDLLTALGADAPENSSASSALFSGAGEVGVGVILGCEPLQPGGPGRAIFLVLAGPPAQLGRGIRGESFSAHVTRQRLEAIGKLVEAGKLRPQVEAVLPFEQVREALRRVADRHTRGKIVLRIGQ